MDVDDAKKQVSTKQANDMINELSASSHGDNGDANAVAKKTIPLFFTSAKGDLNVEFAFKEVARKALQQNQYQLSTTMFDDDEDFSNAINIRLDGSSSDSCQC